MDGIEKDLIVEELTQRYNQYRWEDETRAKFINFYIVFYLAFFALIGYLSEHENLLKKFPYGNRANMQYGIIFLCFGVVGSLWLISIVSFRGIQVLEGRAIKCIKKLSPYLMDQVKYPIDRRIWKTNKLVYSTTPLVCVVFVLNEIVFLLSFYFFRIADVECSENLSIYVNVISVLAIIIYARIWRPKESSIKELDYDKIW